jgi:hypothetical protein
LIRKPAWCCTRLTWSMHQMHAETPPGHRPGPAYRTHGSFPDDDGCSAGLSRWVHNKTMLHYTSIDPSQKLRAACIEQGGCRGVNEASRSLSQCHELTWCAFVRSSHPLADCTCLLQVMFRRTDDHDALY